MKPPPFAYHRPVSLDEALALLERYGSDGRILAGAVDPAELYAAAGKK